MELLGQQIERAVIGLPLPLVGHRDLNRRIPLAPDHAADIAPHYVTFVFEQDNHFSPLNRFPPRCQFFVISSRRSNPCASLRLGLPFSVRW